LAAFLFEFIEIFPIPLNTINRIFKSMKRSTRITVILVIVFLFAQIAGLVVTNQYIQEKVVDEVTGEITIVWGDLPLSIDRPDIDESSSFMFIFIAIIIGTIIALILMKFKIWIIWRFWFFLAVWICMTVALGAFINAILATIISLALALYKIFKPNIWIHNLTELFLYGGIAAIFVPVMNLFAAIVLLILISFYDAWAVWKSKHMVSLAKAQSKTKIFAGFVIPYKLPKKPKKMKKAVKTFVPVKSAILGGGDIGFTLLFAGVVMKIVGFWTALIVPVFASIALAFLLTQSNKNKFYPAMPFLTVGCFLGLLVVSLIAF
jgi:presenilin-like A22 family membrane protease